jgi:hypothetical protein
VKLAVLWDPLNPMAPVAPVVAALKQRIQVVDLFLDTCTHRTNPNGSFSLRPMLDQIQPDAVLWVEGGPWPDDWSSCPIRKTAWLINAHLEPTLYFDLAEEFNMIFTATRIDRPLKNTFWLPLSAPEKALILDPGIHCLGAGPTPPSHIRLAKALDCISPNLPRCATPVVFCPGTASQPSMRLLEQMASSAAVVIDSDTDIREIGNPDEHFFVYPTIESLPAVLSEMLSKPEHITEVGQRGKHIVDHLHTPVLRSEQLEEYLFSKARILSGAQFQPSISVLTCCYKYLKRFSHDNPYA